jgi:acyl-CoA thioester hydrolase
MPVVHYEIFRVRYYECDAYGHLKNINYLRWMQEAAFSASAAVGYDFVHYTELGHLWLVRETDIEYIAPLEYGAKVKVKTWVADLRRAHSLRRYEFINTETEQVIARASTDWVYINIRTQRPTTVPKALQMALYPDGPLEASTPRERFPQAPLPPPDVFRICVRVEWRDIDTMWHVNNAMYLTYIEDANTRVCEAHGWPVRRMTEAGFRMVVQQHRIEYRQPAQIGDELEIATWYSDVQGATALRHYTIRRAKDQVLLARARTQWVWLDMKTAQPIHVPEGFLAEFADNLSRDERDGNRKGGIPTPPVDT